MVRWGSDPQPPAACLLVDPAASKMRPQYMREHGMGRLLGYLRRLTPADTGTGERADLRDSRDHEVAQNTLT